MCFRLARDDLGGKVFWVSLRIVRYFRLVCRERKEIFELARG